MLLLVTLRSLNAMTVSTVSTQVSVELKSLALKYLVTTSGENIAANPTSHECYRHFSTLFRYSL